MGVASAKTNTNGLFYRIRTSLRQVMVDGRRLTPSEIAIASKVQSFSGTKKTPFCKLPYKQVAQELGVSSATTRKAFKRLIDGAIIQKVERDFVGNAYEFIEELPGKKYDVIPNYLHTRKYNIKGKMRTLKPSHITVLANVKSEALYAAKDVRAILAHPTLSIEYKRDVLNGATLSYKKLNNRALAKKLNLSQKTIKAALAELCDAGILSCADENKGKNRYVYGTYEVIDKTVYDYLFVEKPKKEKKITPEQARIEAADARAERERYYAAQKSAAERRPNLILEKLKVDSEWRDTLSKLAAWERAKAKDELAGHKNRIALHLQRATLLSKKAQILRKYGYTEEDITVKYHCAKCSDTGYLPDGRGCDCYNQRE